MQERKREKSKPRRDQNPRILDHNACVLPLCYNCQQYHRLLVLVATHISVELELGSQHGYIASINSMRLCIMFQLSLSFLSDYCTCRYHYCIYLLGRYLENLLFQFVLRSRYLKLLYLVIRDYRQLGATSRFRSQNQYLPTKFLVQPSKMMRPNIRTS